MSEAHELVSEKIGDAMMFILRNNDAMGILAEAKEFLVDFEFEDVLPILEIGEIIALHHSQEFAQGVIDGEIKIDDDSTTDGS